MKRVAFQVYNVEGPMGALGIRQAYWRIRGYPMSGFYYYYEDGPEIHGDQALTGLSRRALALTVISWRYQVWLYHFWLHLVWLQLSLYR